MFYCEKLATKLFEINPELNFTGRAEEVLNAAWPIAVEELGKKRATYMFNYDEDFTCELVSAYADLVENTLTA